MRIGYAKSEAPQTHSASVASEGPVWIAALQTRQLPVELFPPIVDHSHVLMAENDISAAGLVEHVIEPRIRVFLIRLCIIDVKVLAVSGIETPIFERRPHRVVLRQIAN